MYVVPDGIDDWKHFALAALVFGVTESLMRGFAHYMGWWKPETADEPTPEPVYYEPVGAPRRP